VAEEVTCCLSEPKVESLLNDQIERVKRLLPPLGFFMSHDEIRVATLNDERSRARVLYNWSRGVMDGIQQNAVCDIL